MASNSDITRSITVSIDFVFIIFDLIKSFNRVLIIVATGSTGSGIVSTTDSGSDSMTGSTNDSTTSSTTG